MTAARRPALGKGINALIKSADHAPGILQRTRLPLDRIDPRPDQPRKGFPADQLHALAESIRQYGLLQPIVVAPAEGRYRIIAGERRYRACRQAGLAEIDVVIRETDDETIIALALVENIHRQDLSPLEEARAIATMIDSLNLTQEQAAQRLNISRSAVTNKLRLLALPAAVQVAIEEGRLSEGHGRALLGLAGDPEELARVADRAIREHWSVRNTERHVRHLRTETAPDDRRSDRRQRRDPQLDRLERTLEQSLGLRARIVPGRDSSGKLVLHYQNADDLEALVRLLTRKEK